MKKVLICLCIIVIGILFCINASAQAEGYSVTLNDVSFYEDKVVTNWSNIYYEEEEAQIIFKLKDKEDNILDIKIEKIHIPLGSTNYIKEHNYVYDGISEKELFIEIFLMDSLGSIVPLIDKVDDFVYKEIAHIDFSSFSPQTVSAYSWVLPSDGSDVRVSLSYSGADEGKSLVFDGTKVTVPERGSKVAYLQVEFTDNLLEVEGETYAVLVNATGEYNSVDDMNYMYRVGTELWFNREVTIDSTPRKYIGGFRVDTDFTEDNGGGLIIADLSDIPSTEEDLLFKRINILNYTYLPFDLYSIGFYRWNN